MLIRTQCSHMGHERKGDCNSRMLIGHAYRAVKCTEIDRCPHVISTSVNSTLHVVSQATAEGSIAERKPSTKSQEHSRSDTGHLVTSRKDSTASGTMQDTTAFVIEDPSEQT